MKVYIISIFLAIAIIGCAGSKPQKHELKDKTGWFKVSNIDTSTFRFYNFIPLLNEDDDTTFVFITKNEMKAGQYSQLVTGKTYKLHLQEYILHSFIGNDSLATPAGTSLEIGYKNNTISEFYKILQLIEAK